MNYWVLSAGVVQLVLCGIHFFAGGAEYRRLRPGPARADASKAFDYWLTGHGVFHMVSADLLLGAVFCLLMGAKVMGFHFWLILFIALLYAFYALFWLGTLFSRALAGRIISRRSPNGWLFCWFAPCCWQGRG